MILDQKHFSFLVQVIDRGHPNVTDGYAEGKVLLEQVGFLRKGTRVGESRLRRRRSEFLRDFVIRVPLLMLWIYWIDISYMNRMPLTACYVCLKIAQFGSRTKSHFHDTFSYTRFITVPFIRFG